MPAKYSCTFESPLAASKICHRTDCAYLSNAAPNWRCSFYRFEGVFSRLSWPHRSANAERMPVMRVDTAGHSADAYENKIELVIVLAASMTGLFMQTLDSTIANVALPYMQGSMQASRDQITWVLTS